MDPLDKKYLSEFIEDPNLEEFFFDQDDDFYVKFDEDIDDYMDELFFDDE